MFTGISALHGSRETSTRHDCRPELNDDGELILRGKGKGSDTLIYLTQDETNEIARLLCK